MTKISREKLKIGVREFAVPLKRLGSLGSASGPSSSLPIDLGQAIHESIQERLGQSESDYQAEYPLQITFNTKHYELHIRGRCDGLFDQELPLLEEIKSSMRLDSLRHELQTQADHPYILQLKTYAHIYRQKTGKTPSLRLRLVCTRSRSEELFPVSFEAEAFQSWVEARCAQIEEELKHYAGVVKSRKRLAKKLFFPFAKQRPHQTTLMDGVRIALEQGQHLLLQAPTGLGKTAGVLLPALQFALERGSPVIAIAPKNSQFKAAVDLARIFLKQGVALKVLVVSSKAKACRLEKVTCHELLCSYAKDYFPKVDAANLKLRDKKRHLWDPRYFQQLSEQFAICPYEIAMERLREADLIICDYNYLFAPHASFFDRYFDPIVPARKPVLVIDEAHNLYERVMENYSPAIRLSLLKSFEYDAQTSQQEGFRSVIQKSIGLLQSISSSRPEAQIDLDPATVKDLLDEAWSLIAARWLESGLPTAEDALFQFYRLWNDLHEMLNFPRDEVPLIYKRDQGDELLRALCIDPAPFIKPIYAHFSGVIAFSATLKPFEFYRNMSGFDENTCQTLELGSPFPRENKKILIIPQVRTNFRERHQHYPRIAEIIRRLIAIEPGPYLAFFSSYGFLQSVRSELKLDLDEWSLFTQTQSMNSTQIDALWDDLRPRSGLVLAVQGGSLAEGIDLRGKGLKGVFIVGPAIPSAQFERKLMQEYFDRKYGNGRLYAYVYPAMTRSIQAAGRVVRDEKERGLIVLMDPRFLEEAFQETMPGDWFSESARELVSTQLIREIEVFWEPMSADV